MSPLYLLQYSCMLVFLMLALLLIVSRVQQNTQSIHYKRSRSLLTLAMFMLVVHYFLQMQFSLRAKSDDIGAVVNIVFYVPVAFLISYSIVEMEGVSESVNRFSKIGLTDSLLTVLSFLGGWVYYGSLNMPLAQSVLHVLFIVSMIYFIAVPMLSMRASRRRIIDNTGGDIKPYSRFSRAAYFFLSMVSFTLVFAIVYRPLLFIVGPLVLVSIFLFVHSFVGLGYNLADIEDVLNDEDEDNVEQCELLTTEQEAEMYDKTSVGLYADSAQIAEPQSQPMQQPESGKESVAPTDAVNPMDERISMLLNRWVCEGGFRDTTMNMAKLAQQLYISRRDLSRYFENTLHSTFRIWLSDIRFAEAQRLISLHPEYSNDNISSGCGFSSRSQLYKIFSDKTGMTPREWREQKEKLQN